MQDDRPLNYYLERLFAQIDKQEFASSMEVERVYRMLVGDLIFRLTRSIRYRNGVLTLSYQAAAVRQEMIYRRESFRKKMNAELGGEVVKKVVIR